MKHVTMKALSRIQEAFIGCWTGNPCDTLQLAVDKMSCVNVTCDQDSGSAVVNIAFRFRKVTIHAKIKKRDPTPSYLLSIAGTYPNPLLANARM
jgi:hypothetical protein